MMHNQVPELIGILQKYATNIWPYLRPKAVDNALSNIVLFVADYPNTQFLDRLRHYEDGLKAIISIADYGMIAMGSLQFGDGRQEVSLLVNIELMTADPTLREEMGGKLLRFLTKNRNLVHGTESGWSLESVVSNGVVEAPDSLFARQYSLTLHEIS